MKILLVDLDALVQMAMLSMVLTLQVVKVRIRVPHCMNESKYHYGQSLIYPLGEGILFSRILHALFIIILLGSDQ